MDTTFILHFVLLFSITTSQTFTCECDDPNSGASYVGDTFQFGDCIGECGKGQIMIGRQCQISSCSIIICTNGTENCNPGPCQGTWSEFFNSGPCSNPCGAGRQLRRRVCYEHGTTIRTTSCEGANGANEQSMFVACSSRSGCRLITACTSTTATSAPPPPSETTPSTILATSAAALVTLSTTGPLTTPANLSTTGNLTAPANLSTTGPFSTPATTANLSTTEPLTTPATSANLSTTGTFTTPALPDILSAPPPSSETKLSTTLATSAAPLATISTTAPLTTPANLSTTAPLTAPANLSTTGPFSTPATTANLSTTEPLTTPAASATLSTTARILSTLTSSTSTEPSTSGVTMKKTMTTTPSTAATNMSSTVPSFSQTRLSTMPITTRLTTIRSDKQIPSCSNQTISLNNLNVTIGMREIYERGASIAKCNETGFPLASATCLPLPNHASNGEVFGRFDESTVVSIECGERIANLTNSTIVDLPTLSVLTSAPEVLIETDIATATEILESYLNQSATQYINETTLRLAARTISNLFAGELLTRSNRGDNSRTIEIKSQLLQTLNGFAALVQLPPGTHFIDVITQDINVQVRSLPEGKTSSENGLVFNLTDLRSSSNVVARVSRRPTDNSSAAMVDRPVVFATLLGSRYPLNSNQNTTQVVSVGAQNTSMTSLIVEITFEDADTSRGEMKVKENPVKRQLNQASFVRWDFETMQWTTSLCDTAPPSRTLECSQLASYSILFSRRIVPSIAALAIVSYVGSALSVIFLLLTIFIYVFHKELRDKPTTMTLVNICVCLVGVYLFFAIGAGRVSHHQTCNGLTFLLHYFTLACFAWMTVNAYQMLRAFTSVTYSIERARFAFYVFAYGLPFIAVMINFALTVLFLDRQQVPNDPEDIYYESLYRAKFTCWLQEPSFYWGFLLPIGILMLFSIVVFIILLKKIVFRKQEVRSTVKDRPLADRLVNAIMMIIMMGLTWIFGYFLLIPANVAYETAMQWLFTIFNVFQGVVIFYLYCLRRKNVRNVWFSFRTSWYMICGSVTEAASGSESSTSGTSKTEKTKNTSATAQHNKNITVV